MVTMSISGGIAVSTLTAHKGHPFNTLLVATFLKIIIVMYLIKSLVSQEL